MKILYLITYYNIGDGSSKSLYTQIQCDKKMAGHFVLCFVKKRTEADLCIEEVGDGDYLYALFQREKFDLVHYFKARNSDIFTKTMSILKEMEIHIPVLTTICQRPSYHSLLLTPFEIKHTSHFVFIDKASYNDPLVRFIPDKNKSQIYLAGTDLFIDETDQYKIEKVKEGHPVVFGRGSTIGKCPSNMFEVFDKIDIPNKVFCVSGLPEGSNWIKDVVSTRNDILIYEKLPLSEWIKLCASFDVFLYQLPENCYASIDLVLGLAMLLRKPVVYYGSEAGKERFIHGENGFIANTYSEIAEYATLLGKDENMRQVMGEKAREYIIKKFSTKERTAKFIRLYCTLTPIKPIRIPMWYRLLFIKYCYIDIMKRLFNIYPYGKGFFAQKFAYK